jgi:hypothetical protein
MNGHQMSSQISVARIRKTWLVSCVISIAFAVYGAGAHAAMACESLASVATPFASFVGGNPDGDNVDLMITGVLQHNRVKSLVATSTTVKIHR